MLRNIFKKQSITNLKYKIEVIFWGYNNFSKEFLKIIEPLGCKVKYFIEENASEESFLERPILKPQEFINNEEYKNFPIVITSNHNIVEGVPVIDFESIRQFKASMSYISNKYNIPNRLLHPAALSEMLDIDYTGRAICFGPQGSGNTLYLHILQKIKQHYSINLTKEAFIFERLGYEYANIVYDFTADLASQSGATRTWYAPFKEGYNTISSSLPDGNLLYLNGCHIQTQIFDFCGYHYLPDEEVIKRYVKQNFKLFFIVRNPLDTTLSFTTKSIPNKEEIIKGRFNNVLLDRFKRIKNYYNEVSKIENHGIILRYEDLIENPIKQINQITSLFDIKPKEIISKTIWEELGFKKLPGSPAEHFWKGGIVKYKNYFDKEIMLALYHLDIRNLLMKYNYKDICTEFLHQIKEIDPSKYNIDSLIIALENYLDNFPNLRPLENENNMTVKTLVINSKNHSVRDKIANLIQQYYIYNLLTAGKYHNDPVLASSRCLV